MHLNDVHTVQVDDEASHPVNDQPSNLQNGSGNWGSRSGWGVAARSRPVVYPPVDPPVCSVCHTDRTDAFFNAQCHGCCSLLIDANTTLGQMFAILRQWTPQTQHGLEMIITQMLNIGAHVDDRDGLTDMTMLHYACKAGTRGIGDIEQSCRVVQLLLDNHADPYLRCRWTNMAAIHYATYFDVAPVLKILLGTTKGIDVDSPCSEFDHGSPMHIAVRNLCLESAHVLLDNEADPHAGDINGKTPLDLLPAPENYEADSEAAQQIIRLRTLLEEAQSPCDRAVNYPQPSSEEAAMLDRALHMIGVRVGDKVMVGGIKAGTLRYCGKTSFAEGLWAGVELDEPVGKNNGTMIGVRYFKCPPDYGIFAPLKKISKPGILHRGSSSKLMAGGGSMRNLSPGKINVDHVTAKVNTGLRVSKSVSSDESGSIIVGDRVLVAGRRFGIVRFHGETHFSPGVWFGIELDKPVGKNDGCVNEVRYFTCEPNCGVFAPPSRVQKVATVDAGRPDNQDLASPHGMSTSVFDVSQRRTLGSSDSANNGGSQHFLHRHNAAGSTPRKFVMSRSRTMGSASILSYPAFNASLSSNSPLRLSVGMTVLCAGEIGTVRYVGDVDFADGLWIGVDLRTAKGKHDGSVQGRRYFSCREGHGLIVRPSKVTVRGINGAQLLDE